MCYRSFFVAVIGQMKIQTATDIAVPIATIPNVSVIISKSNSASFPDPCRTITVNIMINANPEAIMQVNRCSYILKGVFTC